MTDIATCEVRVSIAVSESGLTECCIAESNWIQQQRKYKEWLAEKRESKNLWHIKTVRVRVPLPMSFEDMGEIR